MYHTVEEIVIDIWNFEKLKMDIELPVAGEFFSLYSEKMDRGDDDSTVDDFYAKFNEYISTNFIPEWVLNDNEVRSGIVVYHLQDGNPFNAGIRIKTIENEEQNEKVFEELKEVLSTQYGGLFLVDFDKKEITFLTRKTH